MHAVVTLDGAADLTITDGTRVVRLSDIPMVDRLPNGEPVLTPLVPEEPDFDAEPTLPYIEIPSFDEDFEGPNTKIDHVAQLNMRAMTHVDREEQRRLFLGLCADCGAVWRGRDADIVK